MKILYILSQKPGCTGSGFYVQSMIKEALRKKHDCHLISGIHNNDDLELNDISKNNCSFLEFETENIPFALPGMSDVMPYKSTCFKNMTNSQLELYESSFKEKISESINKFKPDVIHSNHLWLVSSFTKEVCPDIPMIISCHGTDLRQMKQCKNLKEKVIKGCQKAEKIIALSKVQKKEIVDIYKIPESKIEIVGTGFNDAIFYPVEKPALPPVKILYAGKLSFAKGVPWLLDSFKLTVSKSNIHVNLYIAGSGSGDEYDICMKKINSMKENVTFLGMLSQNELAEKMRKSHLFILPSFYEGLPLVIFEALASGCRVICTKLPGTIEITGNEGPETVRFIDLPKLEYIDRPYEKDIPMLTNTLSKIIAEESEALLSKNRYSFFQNQELIKKYTWKKIFSSIESIIEDLKS